MTRKRICLTFIPLCLVLLSLAATRNRPRQRMVAMTVKNVIVPRQEEMHQSFLLLHRAAEKLHANPTTNSLASTRQAWRRAFLAWKRVNACPAGPISDQRLQNQIHFWPTRPAVIESTIRSFDPEMDFASFSVAGKGLSAMEYLLFHPRAPAITKQPRRAEFLAGLTGDLCRLSSGVTNDWTQAHPKLAGGGQDSINEMINHLIFGVEVLAMNQLRSVVALHASGRLREDYIEGGISDVSRQSALASLESARKVFRGGAGFGIDDYLRETGQEPLRVRIEKEFEKTIAALKSLGQPLELAVESDRHRVQRAQSHCKELEIILKVELGSRLGITLMFGLNDGD